MGAFADALAQVQQFIAQRQLSAQSQPQQMRSPNVAGGTDPIYGGSLSQLPGLLQAAQANGMTPGGNYTGTDRVITQHGVTGDPHAMSLLSQVAQQYPHLWDNVISSYRTRAEQAALYQDYIHGNGNLAARPGTSNHETGDAFDISASWINSKPGLRDLLNKLGGFPVGGEPWHWEAGR